MLRSQFLHFSHLAVGCLRFINSHAHILNGWDMSCIYLYACSAACNAIHPATIGCLALRYVVSCSYRLCINQVQNLNANSYGIFCRTFSCKHTAYVLASFQSIFFFEYEHREVLLYLSLIIRKLVNVAIVLNQINFAITSDRLHSLNKYFF